MKRKELVSTGVGRSVFGVPISTAPQVHSNYVETERKGWREGAREQSQPAFGQKSMLSRIDTR